MHESFINLRKKGKKIFFDEFKAIDFGNENKELEKLQDDDNNEYYLVKKNGKKRSKNISNKSIRRLNKLNSNKINIIKKIINENDNENDNENNENEEKGNEEVLKKNGKKDNNENDNSEERSYLERKKELLKLNVEVKS